MTYHYGMQWCTIPDCPCGMPGKPCTRWEGYAKGHGRYDPTDKETWPFRWCLSCGWEKSDHRQLIHNGRKP